ncbi:MAG: hypothetical protein OET41_08820 [Xanthomonadales bacterium]|nr:hypothetical protein [Xanthomonadales bacterium]MDH3939498.1 hypothetical protein [Xanthomonadales bacterium]
MASCTAKFGDIRTILLANYRPDRKGLDRIFYPVFSANPLQCILLLTMPRQAGFKQVCPKRVGNHRANRGDFLPRR